LQSLDKLNSSESRVVKSLNFDRQKLLDTLQIYWANGLSYGYKFAKLHLNYKPSDATEKVWNVFPGHLSNSPLHGRTMLRWFLFPRRRKTIEWNPTLNRTSFERRILTEFLRSTTCNFFHY